MKLLQLNMWWGGKLADSIINLIKEVNPDIICLQEAVSFDREDAGLFLTVEQIKDMLGYKHSALAPLFSFNLMHGTAKFGNAIITNLPIKESFSLYTSLEHIENFDFNKHDYNVRNMLDCTLVDGKKQFHVLTHHGYHVPHHKNGNAKTLRHMKMIAAHIDKLSGPVILTGDFNLTPHSESIELINNKLINLSIKHRLKTTRSHLTHKTEVCDYIFVNDKVKVKSFGAAEELVSDHKALIMEFSL